MIVSSGTQVLHIVDQTPIAPDLAHAISHGMDESAKRLVGIFLTHPIVVFVWSQYDGGNIDKEKYRQTLIFSSITKNIF